MDLGSTDLPPLRAFFAASKLARVTADGESRLGIDDRQVMNTTIIVGNYHARYRREV